MAAGVEVDLRMPARRAVACVADVRGNRDVDGAPRGAMRIRVRGPGRGGAVRGCVRMRDAGELPVVRGVSVTDGLPALRVPRRLRVTALVVAMRRRSGDRPLQGHQDREEEDDEMAHAGIVAAGSAPRPRMPIGSRLVVTNRLEGTRALT